MYESWELGLVEAAPRVRALHRLRKDDDGRTVLVPSRLTMVLVRGSYIIAITALSGRPRPASGRCCRLRLASLVWASAAAAAELTPASPPSLSPPNLPPHNQPRSPFLRS